MPLPSLSGIRLLIVEDSFMVADSLRILLESCDATVIGMAGTLEQGAAMAAEIPFDIAILDIDLHGINAAPLAEDLVRRGRPFLFLSGHGELGLLPEKLQGYPRLPKPVNSELLVSTILEVTAAGTTRQPDRLGKGSGE